MSRWFEHVAARLALIHASRVYRNFERALGDLVAQQDAALRQTLAVVANSDFGRRYQLARVRTRDDLRRALPLMTYEDYRPWIERVASGESGALLAPRQRLHMFATSSGTTAKQKLIPVTDPFVREYRRGWNTFGLKLLSDHPDAVLRHILQVTGRIDESRTAAGIPCGAITGLLAKTQKRIVRRFYVGKPALAQIDDPQARYYTLMRLALAHDVAFAITANPATLIRLAHTLDDDSERLIRDVRDGTLSEPAAEFLKPLLARTWHPAPQRAAELERVRAVAGRLLPRDAWNLSFLACWTGGSLGHYLPRVADLWGEVPVRDVGLMASEGRVTIPLDDGTPAGVLDVAAGCFEFIPAADSETDQPDTLSPEAVQVGQEYEVVLSNTTGLLRYRLGDVVRVTGKVGPTPVMEFRHRAGRVASVAGEKLTEFQLVAAVAKLARRHSLSAFEFVVAPVWGDPPHYRLTASVALSDAALVELDRGLAEQNDEYASRRKSLRLGPLSQRTAPAATFAAMDHRLQARRGGTHEQYKRQTLLTTYGADDDALSLQSARPA